MVELSRVSSGIQPVRQLSIVDRVAAEIRRSILIGALPPGQPFSIADLCAQLQVSHIPVREALQRLEREGLLRLRPGRSAVVAPVDADDLKEIYRLRRLLEVDLAGRACPRFSDRDLAQLKAHLEAFFTEPPDADRMLSEHHEFHLALLRPAASDWDLRILQILWNASERYVRLFYANTVFDVEQAAQRTRAHASLLAAAQSRSPEQLQQAVRKHLDDNELTMLTGITRITAPGAEVGDDRKGQ